MNVIRWNNPATLSDMFDNFLFDDHKPYRMANKHCGPATNIIENKDSFVLDLAVPGVKKDDFKVNLDNKFLNISLERKNEKSDEKTNYTRREFSYNSFSRSFSLPDSVDAEKIKAEYIDGILSITLPKKDEAKLISNKEIKIS
jgi:HSP20 family protein